MQNISTTIRRIKIEALKQKKEHFKAAERKQIVRYWIAGSLILINILSTIILYQVVPPNAPEWFHYFPLIGACTTILLISYQLVAHTEMRAQAHKRIANKYCAVLKKINRLESYMRDDLIAEQEIIPRIEKISLELDEISSEGLTEPTTDADYIRIK